MSSSLNVVVVLELLVLAQRRYELIMQILRAEAPVAVGVLANRLEVSAATIRRDLNRLGRLAC